MSLSNKLDAAFRRRAYRRQDFGKDVWEYEKRIKVPAKIPDIISLQGLPLGSRCKVSVDPCSLDIFQSKQILRNGSRT
jgi:hypothetical protein